MYVVSQRATSAEISVCTGKRGNMKAYCLANKSEVFMQNVLVLLGKQGPL